MRDAPPCLLATLSVLCLLSAVYVLDEFSLRRWSLLPGAAWQGDPGAPAGAPAEGERTAAPGARAGPPKPEVRPQGRPVARRNATAGAAAEPAAPGPAPPEGVALAPSEVLWLHVPKCGTSFIYVLVAWACPSSQQPNCDIAIGSVGRACKELKHLNCAGHWVMGNQAFEAGQGRFVSVFRQPEQRMVSHYWFRGARLRQPWPEFIRDVEGCQAKALTGHGCIVPYALTDADIELAVHRVRFGFAFVGVLEEWSQTVCLFHKMFGGSCRPDEAMHYRQNAKRRKDGGVDSDGNYNVSVLNGYVDKADTRVYDAAMEVFQGNLRRYAGSRSPAGCEAFCL